jgi:hypothetical protein
MPAQAAGSTVTFRSRSRGVDGRLRDAHLGRRADHDQPFRSESREQQLERRQVERGVPRLDDESIPRAWGERLDQLPARPLAGLAHQPFPVAVPRAAVVVGVRHRDLRGTRRLERLTHPRCPPPEALEQAVPVGVIEVVQHVDHEQQVAHGRDFPRRPG